ncbi:MAG: DUF4340 domain-containing protein [Chloroflexi bacterium]|nr:DUF4340 domain-containing protein [Chloroflexota bacterium]
MNIRTSVLLVIALALVSGYVFFAQREGTVEPTDEPPWFYNVELNDMRQITITHLGEEAVFALGTDGRWHLGDPDGLPVGGERWGGIESLLSGPKTRRMLDPQPAELEPYGLDSPPTRIEVDLKDGRTIPLLLGLLAPNEGNHYAQIEGFPQVFLVYSGWGDVLTRLISEPPYPPWYYNIDTSTLTDIELESGGQKIALTKNEDGWHFSDDEAPVGEAQLASIVDALDQRPAQQLVEYAVDDVSPYGLDEPTFTVFLTTERLQEAITFVTDTFIEVGNPTEDGKAYYARSSQTRGVADVYRIDTEWVDGLKAIVANWPSIGTSDPGGTG